MVCWKFYSSSAPKRAGTRQTTKFAASKRTEELSKPKRKKTIWVTEFAPNVLWGTQDQLSPATPAALQAVASSRLIKLAEPKKDFTDKLRKRCKQYVYSCGRVSPLWQVEQETLKAVEISERLAHLAQPKQAPAAYTEKESIRQYVYSCGRPSAIWKVDNNTVLPAAWNETRLEKIAKPRKRHDDRLARPAQTRIPAAALTVKPSQTINNLAKPHLRPALPYRDPAWMVSAGAKKAEPSTRCLELAVPNKVAPPLSVDDALKVSRTALTATPSGRIEELATPITRLPKDHLQFDPEAFNVKAAALKATCTARTRDLAIPISR